MPVRNRKSRDPAMMELRGHGRIGSDWVTRVAVARSGKQPNKLALFQWGCLHWGMNTPKKHRRNSSIPTARWAGYAAAATATGFAVAPSAEAAIHYSGLLNAPIVGNRVLKIPLGSVAGSFVIIHSFGKYGSTSRTGNARFYLSAGSPSVNGFPFGNEPAASVSNLDRGDRMSARPLVPDGGVMASNSCGCSHGIRGQFRGQGVGFIGFKFNNGAGDQYGWVRVRMFGGIDHQGKLIDFAYGDPGEKVVAGQKESHNSAPALESLGGLAFGAAGLLAWRRRRED